MKRISEALVVRTVAYGESDVIATLLTQANGKLGALVRGGRKSQRRVGGALEPFHTISVHLEDSRGDLATLKEAKLVRVRAGIVSNLDALDAAGTALRWARHLFPPRHAEPKAYQTVVELLDALDAGASPRVALAAAALRLLADVGYAIELGRCVRCGKPCPDGKPSFIDAARGGLVCKACGGARRVLDAQLRALAQAAQRGEVVSLEPQQAQTLLAIVDDAMAAHTGFEEHA